MSARGPAPSSSSPRSPAPEPSGRGSIMDQMAEAHRVLRKARMLPTDRPLTPEEIQQIGRDFHRWLNETRRSASSVARALGKGYSEARLSHFRHGKYVGDAEEVARALNAYMEQETRSEAVARPEGFVETEAAKRMMTTIIHTIDAAAIGLIYGPAGVGKTMTMQAMNKMSPGSVYLRVINSTRRGAGMCSALAAVLGVSRRSTYDARQRLVIEALRGTRRALLIDEAQQLHESGVECLRDIHDDAGVPIILCGTVDVRKTVDDANAFYGQISSRVMIRCDITEFALRPRRPRPLFSLDEIRQVFDGDKLRLTDDGAQLLAELACIPGLGSLRLCRQLVTVAASLRGVDRMAIAGDTLIKVLRDLHGESWSKAIAERRAQQAERGVKVA